MQSKKKSDRGMPRVFVSGSFIIGLSPNLTIHAIRHRRYLKVTPSVTLKRHSQALVAPVPLLVRFHTAMSDVETEPAAPARQRRSISAVFYERAVIIPPLGSSVRVSPFQLPLQGRRRCVVADEFA